MKGMIYLTRKSLVRMSQEFWREELIQNVFSQEKLLFTLEEPVYYNEQTVNLSSFGVYV
jgi:hypothetical protein